MITITNTEGLVARRVSIDEWLTAIPCLMDPRQRWNGWACPYFARDAVERIILAIAPEGGEYTKIIPDWDAATVTMISGEGTDDEYTDVVEAHVIDGTPYWPVGSWGWVWSDDDEDNCPNASDYAPCRVDGCDHDPDAIAREVERWEEVSDQALWITMLTLDIVGESHSAPAMDASSEIARRYGPDATEWSADLFTRNHSTGAEMLALVSGKDWKWFDRNAREATKSLRHDAIQRAMVKAFDEAGIATSWEHPGILVFTTPDGRTWGTGMNGWHYATDWAMQDDAMLEIAAEEESIAWMSAEQIAEAWVAIVKGA
jgi:hypothetical protein